MHRRNASRHRLAVTKASHGNTVGGAAMYTTEDLFDRVRELQVQRNTQEQEIRRLRAALVRKEQEASRARHQLEDVEARAAAAASAPATGRHAIRPSAIKATPAATREAKLVRRCGVLQDMVDRLQREVEELRKSSAAADEAQQQALVYATEIRRLRAQLQQQQTAGSSPRRRPRPSSAQSRRTASSSAYLAPQPMQALEDRETISSNNNTTHMVKLHARLQAVQEREAELQHQIEEAQRVMPAWTAPQRVTRPASAPRARARVRAQARLPTQRVSPSRETRIDAAARRAQRAKAVEAAHVREAIEVARVAAEQREEVRRASARSRRRAARRSAPVAAVVAPAPAPAPPVTVTVVPIRSSATTHSHKVVAKRTRRRRDGERRRQRLEELQAQFDAAAAKDEAREAEKRRELEQGVETLPLTPPAQWRKAPTPVAAMQVVEQVERVEHHKAAAAAAATVMQVVDPSPAPSAAAAPATPPDDAPRMRLVARNVPDVVDVELQHSIPPRPASLPPHAASDRHEPPSLRRGGLWHCAWSSATNRAKRQEWLQELFQAVLHNDDGLLEGATLLPFLQRQTSRLDSMCAQPLAKTDNRLTFNLFCKFVLSGAALANVTWGDAMTEAEFVEAADAAFTARKNGSGVSAGVSAGAGGGGGDASPSRSRLAPSPRKASARGAHFIDASNLGTSVRDLSNLGEEDDNSASTAAEPATGGAGAGAGAGAESAEDMATVALQAHAALQVANKMKTAGGRPTLHVTRGGIWHCSWCAECNREAREEWFRDMFTSLPGSDLGDVEAQDVLPFLQRQVTKLQATPAPTGGRLTFALFCKFVLNGAYDLGVEWPESLDEDEFVEFAERAFLHRGVGQVEAGGEGAATAAAGHRVKHKQLSANATGSVSAMTVGEVVLDDGAEAGQRGHGRGGGIVDEDGSVAESGEFGESDGGGSSSSIASSELSRSIGLSSEGGDDDDLPSMHSGSGSDDISEDEF